MENFNTVPSQGKFGDSVAVVNENFLLAQQEMEILRNLISPDTKFVTAVATAQTTSVAQVLPETGSTDTVYRVGNWDGSQYNISYYSEYSWNDNEYVFLSAKTGSPVNQKYIENDKYLEAWTDANNKLILAVRKDGYILFGAGVPPQIAEYLTTVINNLGLENYDDIVTFLGELINSDKTLGQLLSEINEVVPSLIDNPSYLEVVIDKDRKTTEATRKNGDKIFFSKVLIKGGLKADSDIDVGDNRIIEKNVSTPSYDIRPIDNQSWSESSVDDDGKFIEGLKKDGTKKIAKLEVLNVAVKENLNLSKKATKKLKEDLGTQVDDASDIVKYYNSHLVKEIEELRRWSDFMMFFFSDVHGSQKNVQRIFDLANSFTSSKVQCIVNGGDTVAGLLDEGLAWYNTLVANCSIPVLHTPGNHDAWSGSMWHWADKKDIYNLITAKVKANVPSIVQPANAAENGLCYYYKDFGHVRVISIMSMTTGGSDIYYDAAQNTWLASVLEDARTTYHYWKIVNNAPAAYTLQAGDVVTGTLVSDSDLSNHPYNYYTEGSIYAVPMSVVIMNHMPYVQNVAVRVESKKINSWFDYTKDCFAKGINSDKMSLSEDAVSTVANYINNGGCFICWLTGHVHMDSVLTHTTHQGQLMINISSAKFTNHSDSVPAENDSNPDYDCFDYIGIDLRSSMIKVLRIGMAKDSSMRVRRSWCYDYINQKLLSEN